MHVAFHKFFVQVNLIEITSDWVRNNIQVVETSNIFMATEELQELQLTEQSLAQDLFGKDVRDFFDGHEVFLAVRHTIIVLC